MTKPLHALDVTDVVAQFNVDPTVGLSSSEVDRRASEFGPNVLAEAKKIPGWRRFLAQFQDLLILILIAAAFVALFVSGDVKTPAVVMVVVVLNALIGFIQESRAEASLDALKKMLSAQSRVRRNGELISVPFSEIVPGDIVVVEAGDRIPADARILSSTNLEIEEAALTGESQPSSKSADAVTNPSAQIGDRTSMTYMNTTVTRGRAELVVTSTGMATEIGRIAGLLQQTETDRTPLQKQLDGLAHSLAALAGVIVALVGIIGLARGEEFSDVLLRAVALAVAAIPEGLPAVTVVTLAIGVSKMAKENAIVKRLASVETLGCTSVICSDKTGTLTLNQMTVHKLVVQGVMHNVTGEGYSPSGEIRRTEGDDEVVIDNVLRAMALCNDSEVRNVDGEWILTGDPTEGAMAVLAMKGGVDVLAERQSHPRIAEVPFDSLHKFMATAHRLVDSDGNRVVRIYAKGAPDVLADRSTHLIGPNGEAMPMATYRDTLEMHNSELAGDGLRVLAVAQRTFSEEVWDELQSQNADLFSLIDQLTFIGMVGIVDPARPEARDAIADAKSAGIAVKMITGDHAVTAAAIAKELGLTGRAITGAQLAEMSDSDLSEQIDEIGVFARVAPEHKMRLIAALQAKGNVVAMTGDGVNDAPALKKADMGVAMGITGTEVSKEAATMVLTDDNFTTIVRAVRQGRAIYDNIVKFVRFQLSTTIGFAALFLFAALFNVAGGKPFTAIAILWVNIIMDGPPAMALGLDRPATDAMTRPPRPTTERILTRDRWFTVILSATVMAAGTIAVLAWHPDAPTPIAGTPSEAGTMAFNTFVLFQFFNILNVRNTGTVFQRNTFTNWRLWSALGAVIILQVGVTHLGFLQTLFDTTDISGAEWLWSIAIASSVLWVEEIRKLVRR